jgi:hypothetical protein
VLLIYSVFEEVYGLEKAALLHRYDHIYWVEIFVAIETSCQVGFMIGGRMEVEAQWAAEPEYIMCIFDIELE